MKKAIGICVLLGAIAVVLWLRPKQRDSGTAEEPGSSAVSSPTGDGKAPEPKKVPALGDPTTDVGATERKQLKLLNEILESKNDNDPRLDKELRYLSQGTKDLLRGRYQELAPEKLNERGTIVFLIGRNLSTEADFRFMKEVLHESPCLSLADCKKNAGAPTREDLHQEVGMEVSLNYPQLVALQNHENYLKQAGASPALKALAYQNLESALTSPVPAIARKAEEILKRLRGRS